MKEEPIFNKNKYQKRKGLKRNSDQQVRSLGNSWLCVGQVEKY